MDCKNLIIENEYGYCAIKRAPEKYIDIENSIKEEFIRLWTERMNETLNSIPPISPINCPFYNFPLTNCSDCPVVNLRL